MNIITDDLFFRNTDLASDKIEIIRHTEGTLLIIAGPGSAKILVKYLCGSNELGRSGGKNGFTGNS